MNWRSIVFVAVISIGAACAQEPTVLAHDTAEPIVDTTRPTWPESASLIFLKVREDSLIVQWPEANDDVAVTSYIINQRVDEEDIIVGTVPGSSRTLQLSQLTPSATLELVVQAKDAAGNISQNGPSGSVELADETAPSWPDNAVIIASALTASSATLSWPNAQDAQSLSGYRLYQNNIEIANVPADTTSFTTQDLDPFTLYEFRVEAEDALQNLSTDGPKTSVRTSDETPPSWPENAALSAVSAGETRIDLGWDAALDDVQVNGYRIFQNAEQIAIVPGEKTWLTVGGLSAGTAYTFEVVAIDAGGNESLTPLSTSVSTRDETKPVWSGAAWLQGADGTDTSLAISWSEASDNVAVTGYDIYQNNLFIESVAAPQTETTVLNLSPSVTYIFRVEAFDASGNQTQGGPTLLVDLSDQTPPWWPEGASCSEADLSATSVTINWSTAEDNTGVAGYLVFANGEELGQTNGTTQTLSVTGLSALTSYTLQVFAVDGAGNTSEDGPLITITTPDYPTPSWPEEAQVQLNASGPNWASLSWTQMPQTDAVLAIVIYQDDEETLTLDANATSATVSGLSPQTSYDLRVEASGPTGLISTDGPSITVTTPDYTAPEWTSSATLVASDVTETALFLTWTGAIDMELISSFTVTQDDAVLATVYPPETSLAVDALSPGTSYTFTVEATGPTGLVSTTGPSTTIITQDDEAPFWPEDAVVTVDWVDATSAGLSWSPAVDNVAVQSYDLFLQGALEMSVDGQTTSVTLTNLSPQSLYSVEIRGLDPAMNQTAQTIDVSFTTSSTTSGLSTQDVYEGLLPHCDLCHITGNTPFFDSVANFESLIVENDEYVIPGDPDASLLIKVLEGNGSPPWIQMPLSGGNFQQLSNQGKTSITMAEIRSWVLNLEVE